MIQAIKVVEVIVTYRWFLIYGFTNPVTYFSIFGKNYPRRFADNNQFEIIFQTIPSHLIKNGNVLDCETTSHNAKSNKKIVQITSSSFTFINKITLRFQKKPIFGIPSYDRYCPHDVKRQWFVVFLMWKYYF